MPGKGLRPSNRNERKLMEEVEGFEPNGRKKYGEDEGLTPGSPIVMDGKKKQSKAPIPSYEKGGTVKKTGLAMVHKGEKITPAKESATARFIRTRNAQEARKRGR